MTWGFPTIHRSPDRWESGLECPPDAICRIFPSRNRHRIVIQPACVLPRSTRTMDLAAEHPCVAVYVLRGGRSSTLHVTVCTARPRCSWSAGSLHARCYRFLAWGPHEFRRHHRHQVPHNRNYPSRPGQHWACAHSQVQPGPAALRQSGLPGRQPYQHFECDRTLSSPSTLFRTGVYFKRSASHFGSQKKKDTRSTTRATDRAPTETPNPRTSKRGFFIDRDSEDGLGIGRLSIVPGPASLTGRCGTFEGEKRKFLSAMSLGRVRRFLKPRQRPSVDADSAAIFGFIIGSTGSRGVSVSDRGGKRQCTTI